MTPSESEQLLWFLIVWAAIGGGVGALIGTSRDRLGAGFWLGFWLGVIGWIIVALMEPSAAERRRRRNAELREIGYASAAPLGHPAAVQPYEPEKWCPFCAERIKLAAIVCRFCGRSLQESIPTTGADLNEGTRPYFMPTESAQGQEASPGSVGVRGPAPIVKLSVDDIRIRRPIPAAAPPPSMSTGYVTAAPNRDLGQRSTLPLIAALVCVVAGGVAMAVALWPENTAQRELPLIDTRDYPLEVRSNFMNSCVANGGARNYCSCVLERVEQRFTLESFVELDRAAARTGVVPPAMIAVAAAC